MKRKTIIVSLLIPYILLAKWETMKKIDEISDKEVKVLSTSDGKGNRLNLRQTNGELQIFLSTKNHTVDVQTITTRFDKQEPLTFGVDSSKSKMAIFIPEGTYTDFVMDNIIKSNQLLVRYSAYLSNQTTLKFDLSGIRNAMKSINFFDTNQRKKIDCLKTDGTWENNKCTSKAAINKIMHTVDPDKYPLIETNETRCINANGKWLLRENDWTCIHVK